MAAILGGYPCEDPATLKASCDESLIPTDKWWGKANAFTLTAGEEPGRGHVLLKKSSLDALTVTSYLTLTFRGTTARNERSFENCVLVGYECVTPGAPDDPDAVYLCEVADQRHLFRMTAFATGYKAYNVTRPDGTAYQTDTLNSGVAWTWQQVVTSLQNAVGSALGTLTLPFTPHGAPENLIFTGSPWAALNDVLTRLGCVIAFDDAGAYTVVRLGSAQDDPLTELERSADYLGRTWDGYSGEPARAWRPETIRVLFPRRPTPDFDTGENPYYAADVTLATAPGVEPGTVVTLYADLTAVGQTGTPSNAAALATRAQERADDWLRSRSNYERPLVRAWRDIQPRAVKAVGRSVASATYDDRGGEMRTWVRAWSDDALERWKPLGEYPVWWPFAASGGGTGATSHGDVIGPDAAQTGQLAYFSDPSGRFVLNTANVFYQEARFSNGTQAARGVLAAPGHNAPFGTNPHNGPAQFDTVNRLAAPAAPAGVTYSGELSLYQLFAFDFQNPRLSDQSRTVCYANEAGELFLVVHQYALNNNAYAGRHEVHASGGVLHDVTVGIQNWMAHYTSSGTAGISGTFTVKDGSGTNQTVTVSEGIITGWTT